jgi:CBS domain-containing protein
MPIVTIFPGTLSGGARLGLRVVSTMLEHDVDLVPVMDGAKTVGVILMTDVFDNVAEYVLERSAK